MIDKSKVSFDKAVYESEWLSSKESFFFYKLRIYEDAHLSFKGEGICPACTSLISGEVMESKMNALLGLEKAKETPDIEKQSPYLCFSYKEDIMIKFGWMDDVIEIDECPLCGSQQPVVFSHLIENQKKKELQKSSSIYDAVEKLEGGQDVEVSFSADFDVEGSIAELIPTELRCRTIEMLYILASETLKFLRANGKLTEWKEFMDANYIRQTIKGLYADIGEFLINRNIEEDLIKND